MQIVETIDALRVARAALRGRVGLVPTMGYLHEGHRSLVCAIGERCDQVIATIYVNPTQFAPDEDLSTYPRDLERDFALLEREGVALVFTPSDALMYPKGYQTYVTVEGVTQGREGGTRPTHFRGVTTIVAKLFNLTQPDVAIFGQKDAQQVVVLRQMVRDLNIPIEILVGPIVREADGLALSSRNVYLDTPERSAALVLSQALAQAAEHYDRGERDPRKLLAVVQELVEAEPLAVLDYVSLATARTFVEVARPTEEPLLLSVAVQVGKPRLLDNTLLPASLNTLAGATATLGVV